jgi:hypothetical protein
VTSAGNDVESRIRNCVVQTTGNPRRQEWIVLPPDDCGGSIDFPEAKRERRRVDGVELEEMLYERVPPFDCAKGTNVVGGGMCPSSTVRVAAE